MQNTFFAHIIWFSRKHKLCYSTIPNNNNKKPISGKCINHIVNHCVSYWKLKEFEKYEKANIQKWF